MQIDKAKAKREGLCFRCGKEGHRSFQCPTFREQRQCIREVFMQLDDEEVEEMMAELNIKEIEGAKVVEREEDF